MMDNTVAAAVVCLKWSACRPGAFFAQATEWLFRETRLARGCFMALGKPCDLSAIEAPIFVLAAAGDVVIPPPQTLALQRLCPRAKVRARVAPGVHLSLFMGADMLAGPWREIAGDLAGLLQKPRVAKAASAPAPLRPSRSSRSHAPGAS